MSAAAQLLIPARYNGPPGSGNGGYTAGLVASQLPGQPVEVTLRVPPPLDTPLRVESTADRGIEVYEGTRLVAEARPVEFDDPLVPGVSYEEAVAASADYAGFVDHPFPTCFVCGPQRDDGLRIFPGPLPDARSGAGATPPGTATKGGPAAEAADLALRRVTAAPWRVPADVDAVTVWAALDCPGGWAVIAVAGSVASPSPGAGRTDGNPAPDTPAGRPYVLGRMTARVSATPDPGTDCVVMGALVATEGRKAQVRSTLYTSGGEPLAHARSTWLSI